MLHTALDSSEDLAGVAFEPVAVEGFGHDPKLDDEVARQILRLNLAAFLPPQPDEGGLIVTYDDASVRAADEVATSVTRVFPDGCFHGFLLHSKQVSAEAEVMALIVPYGTICVKTRKSL
jgi:hypothetical protein